MSKTKAQIEDQLEVAVARATKAETKLADEVKAKEEAVDLVSAAAEEVLGLKNQVAGFKTQIAQADAAKEAAEAEKTEALAQVGELSAELEAALEKSAGLVVGTLEEFDVEEIHVEGFNALTNVKHNGKPYKAGQHIPVDDLSAAEAQRLIELKAIVPVAGDSENG